MGQAPSYFVHINNANCNDMCTAIEQCIATYTTPDDKVKLQPDDYYCNMTDKAKAAFITVSIAILMVLIVISIACIQDKCIRIDAVAPYRDYDEKRDKTGWIFYPEFAKIEDPIEVTETVFPSFPSYPPAIVSAGSTSPNEQEETPRLYPKITTEHQQKMSTVELYTEDEELGSIGGEFDNITSVSDGSECDDYSIHDQVGKVPFINENTLCPTDFESFNTNH